MGVLYNFSLIIVLLLCFFYFQFKKKKRLTKMNAIMNHFVFADDDEDDDLDDAILLHILHAEELLGNRAALYGAFNLNNLNNTQCLSLFRFRKEDINPLRNALGLPDQLVFNRIPLSGCDGLCMLLRRLTYPNRLVDLEPIFGYSSIVISEACNLVMEMIAGNKGHLLDNLNNIIYLNYNKLTQFSQAIIAKGSPVDNCFGFIDGTARAVCRPSINQEAYYSGHKKTHCVKYQSVITPDGIIVSLKGAYEGRRHDAGILRDSQFYNELEENVVFEHQRFCIYGDQGYGIGELLLRPYTEHEILVDPNRQDFNNAMRALRVTVEWGFNRIIQLFAFLDFKKKQKLLVQDISNMYKVATILTNCHACLYGGETSQYFNVDPPRLQEYLG